MAQVLGASGSEELAGHPQGASGVHSAIPELGSSLSENRRGSSPGNDADHSPEQQSCRVGTKPLRALQPGGRLQHHAQRLSLPGELLHAATVAQLIRGNLDLPSAACLADPTKRWPRRMPSARC